VSQTEAVSEFEGRIEKRTQNNRSLLAKHHNIGEPDPKQISGEEWLRRLMVALGMHVWGAREICSEQQLLARLCDSRSELAHEGHHWRFSCLQVHLPPPPFPLTSFPYLPECHILLLEI